MRNTFAAPPKPYAVHSLVSSLYGILRRRPSTGISTVVSAPVSIKNGTTPSILTAEIVTWQSTVGRPKILSKRPTIISVGRLRESGFFLSSRYVDTTSHSVEVFFPPPRVRD